MMKNTLRALHIGFLRLIHQMNSSFICICPQNPDLYFQKGESMNFKGFPMFLIRSSILMASKTKSSHCTNALWYSSIYPFKFSCKFTRNFSLISLGNSLSSNFLVM